MQGRVQILRQENQHYHAYLPSSFRLRQICIGFKLQMTLRYVEYKVYWYALTPLVTP